MSTNQSFVGAYARRHRSARLTPPTNAAAPSVESGLDSTLEEIEALAQAASVEETVIESPQINVYPAPRGAAQQSVSVQDTASTTDSITQKTVWIDGSEGQIYRVDTPVTDESDSHSGATDPVGTDPVGTDTVGTDTVDKFESSSEVDALGQTDPQSETTDVAVEPSVESATQPISEPSEVQPAANWAGARWEVDGFAIPTSVADLFFDEAFFQSIAEHMHESVRTGLQSMLVTSIASGAGRSTVAIGMAIAAAASGLRVALVDLDLESPDLADSLRLDTEADWVAAIRHGESLETVSIASIEDNITLVPLSASEARTLPVTSHEIDQLLDQLTNCFDLVLFDGPTAGAWSTARIAANVDSCLIVRDVRVNDPSDIDAAAQKLRRQGVQGIGVVDNFCR